MIKLTDNRTKLSYETLRDPTASRSLCFNLGKKRGSIPIADLIGVIYGGHTFTFTRIRDLTFKQFKSTDIIKTKTEEEKAQER